MKLVKKWLFLILVGLTISFTLSYSIRVSASTSVSGVITENTTWGLNDSTNYRVLGDVVVDRGVVLTIEAGVTIEFVTGTNLAVDGALDAKGTEANPIIFTSNASSPSVNDWGTITLRGSTLESTITWGIIEHASKAVTVESGEPSLVNCTIWNSEYGLWVTGGSPTINNCTISSNDKWGIYNYVGTITLQDTTIRTNGGDGIRKDSGTITIIHSTITNNTGNGITAGAGSPLSIVQSVVSNNSGHGIDNGMATLTVNNCTLAYNDGDGIYMSTGTNSGSITMNFSVISNNAGNGIYKASGTLNMDHNIIQNNLIGIAATPFKKVDSDNFQDILATEITHNNIHGNTEYDIKNIGPQTNIFGASKNLEALNNWWGTSDTSQIDQQVYDFYDDTNLGRVTYTPRSTTPIPLTQITINNGASYTSALAVFYSYQLSEQTLRCVSAMTERLGQPGKASLSLSLGH